MPGSGLHRFAIVLAVCTWVLVAAGVLAPNSVQNRTHLVLGAAVGFLTVVMLGWTWKAEERAWMRKLALWTVIAGGAQGGLGAAQAMTQLPKEASILHACLAQIFFALAVAMAVFTSRSWREESMVVEDAGSPSLRSLAWGMPVALLAQVALGAAYRHQVLGPIPHVVWALGAAMIAVMTASFVLGQFPKHRPLRHAAWWLIGLTSTQIVLGIVALWVRIASAEQTAPAAWMRLMTAAHVGAGALVLSAAVSLACWIRRAVRTVRMSHQLAGSGRAR
jgi:cytochrome c oxidase assembly protein subunit 15